MAETIKQSLGKVSIVPKGEYNELTIYHRLDVVEYKGESFMALSEVQGVVPTKQSEQYMLLVAKGEQGATGERGKDGATGSDGLSPVANVKQTSDGAVITVVDKNGTTSVTLTNGKDGATGAQGEPGKQGLQGEPGIAGKDGLNGKTPVKGVDYYTSEEQQELKSSIKSDIEAKVKTITMESVLLENNTVYRADRLASIAFTLPSALLMNSLFDAEIDITIGATPMEVTAPSAIDWQGDDIVNGAWTPTENKRYVLYIYWDGVRYRAISQSQKVGA